MKLFQVAKDGGPDSNVTGYYLIEWKAVFSIVLLHFANGSREAFHSHAFDAASVLLKGKLLENYLSGGVRKYLPSLRPFKTLREYWHKVVSVGDSWVLSIRGPWVNTWEEYLEEENRYRTLTHGRKEVG